MPCSPDEIERRTIPEESRWETPPFETQPGTALRSWMRLALGFDHRIIDTEHLTYVDYPAPPGAQAAFFIARTDHGSCGSGGCGMTLFVCANHACEDVWGDFSGRVSYPGTSSQGWADFVIDGADLYSYDRGQLRAVCNVEVELPH